MPATPEPDRPAGEHGRRLVFLHGFTQTHHHWHTTAHLIADRLGDEITRAFVDLPGHGLATADDAGKIDTSGARLADLAGSGTYVGYSMGGRMALVAAAGRHPAVERLVLIGATAGLATEADRAHRRRLDDDRADRLESAGVDPFLEDWLAAPLFATLPPDRRGLEHRRRNTAAGLAHSLRRYGTGVQSPLWGALPTLAVPVLVLAGALDRKFAEIGEAMADAMPLGTFDEIPSAGHAAHTEQPVAVADRVVAWLHDDRS